jgi:hypothetical protein
MLSLFVEVVKDHLLLKSSLSEIWAKSIETSKKYWRAPAERRYAHDLTGATVPPKDASMSSSSLATSATCPCL